MLNYKKAVMKQKFCIFLLSMILTGTTIIAQTGGLPQVKTANGVVEGTYESGINVFRGLPFAAPPVGEFRWREPQAVKNWNGVRKADKFGPRAMQLPIFGDMAFRSNGVSEDCLYL